MHRRFIQCDVFTDEPTKGNALAVVVDGDGLSDEQMQSFAAWTNLAETTFLQTPTDPKADYKVRIFTTVREMLFAGHPTLGSCAAWLKSGGLPKNKDVVIQECGVGLVEVCQTGNMPAFVAPPTNIEPLADDAFQSIICQLHINPEKVVRRIRLDNGPVWQILELASAEDVLAVDSSLVKWPEFKAIGLIGPHPDGSDWDYEVRMLAPSSGMSEDPITGSLNSALARWMQAEDRLNKSLIMRQGTVIGRKGRVYISLDKSDPDRVLIGGETQMLISGSVEL